MTIKSNVNKFGFWFSAVGTISGLILLFFYFPAELPTLGFVFYYLVLIILLITYGKILWDANKLIIDTLNESIKFKNRISQISKTYPFSYFDGFIVTFEPMKFENVRNIYLVKNGVFIKKISAFIYLNHTEIEQSLSPIKYLGEIKYSHLNSLKIALGLPILK